MSEEFQINESLGNDTETQHANSSAPAAEANPLEDLISMQPIKQEEVFTDQNEDDDPFSEVLDEPKTIESEEQKHLVNDTNEERLEMAGEDDAVAGVDGEQNHDEAVVFDQDRNSLFSSDVSALTRPSEPQNTDLRQQFLEFEGLDDASNRPITTMLDTQQANDRVSQLDQAFNSEQLNTSSNFGADMSLKRRGTIQMDSQVDLTDFQNEMPSADDQPRHSAISSDPTSIEQTAQIEETERHMTTLIAQKNVDISESDLQMMVALRQLRSYFLNGQFRPAHNLIADRLIKGKLSERQMHFFNVCLVYCLHKLKEFQSAKHVGQDLLKTMERQNSQSFEIDERAFAVKYLMACILYELKQTNESHEMFYELLNEQKAKIQALRKRQGTARTKRESRSGDQGNWTVWDNILVESNELFGAFPPQHDCCAKYIMLAHEICRVHTRMTDYRNAYKVITQCVRLFPKSPFVLSKAGRFCLETGRRAEAIKFFTMVSGLLDERRRQSQRLTQNEVDNFLDGVLGTLSSEEVDEKATMIRVLMCFNSAFIDIFDGKFQEACAKLRDVQKYKPANIVAANNIATCQVFCNQTGRAIEILMDLVKSDRQANINEQVISNMMSFYEIYYPATVADHKNTLVDICSKSSKDAVNAAISIQNGQGQLTKSHM